MTGERYSFFPATRNSVTSVTHFSFGPDAVNSRLSRFGAASPTSPWYDRNFFRRICACRPAHGRYTHGHRLRSAAATAEPSEHETHDALGMSAGQLDANTGERQRLPITRRRQSVRRRRWSRSGWCGVRMGNDKCRVWCDRERVRLCTWLARELLAPHAEGTDGEPLLMTETSKAQSACGPRDDHLAPECFALPGASCARRCGLSRCLVHRIAPSLRWHHLRTALTCIQDGMR
ncbi:hypothetical protein B0G71_7954 [Paraburkholderia sp. BL27I4N3]|nr:hypothetical protein B0G71_7954 [Paraburkholderia sp. BL27I4N3]